MSAAVVPPFGTVPGYFYANAVVDVDERGSPRIAGRVLEGVDLGALSPRPVAIDVAFRDHLMIYHYFHFMELLTGAFAFLREFAPGFAIDRIYVGTQAWNNAKQNEVQSRLLKHVLAPRAIVEGDPAASGNETSELILVVDRFTPVTSYFNKFLETTLRMCRRHMPAMRRRVLEGVGAAVRDRASERATRALYVTREPPRTLGPEAEALLEALFVRNGIEFARVDFAAMTWEEQVAAAHSADWLVGVHGNGLTNLAWLPTGARVLEIFPESSHHYDYQFFAELCGVRYVGVEGKVEPGFVYTLGSRFGPAHGDANRPIEALPSVWLDGLIADMREAER